LILMSIVSCGVMIERYFVFREIEKYYTRMHYFDIKLRLEKHLGILATFGNNAPFIGLFGTVLGIIQAFHMLGESQSFIVSSIMKGISEALIATAAGLFVAIPCVMAYNYFLRRMKRILTQKEAIDDAHS